jgi:hypothetical protein
MTFAAALIASSLTAGLNLDYSPPPLLNAEVELPGDDAPSIPHIGLALDAGTPDGIGVALLIRPWSWLRLQAAALDNTGFGARVGLTWTPIHFAIAPTFTVEAGHFFSASQGGRMVLEDATFGGQLVSTVGYDFATAQAGLEIGPPDSWFAFVRAGASYVRTEVSTGPGMSGPNVVSADALKAGLLIPSVKFGVALYF